MSTVKVARDAQPSYPRECDLKGHRRMSQGDRMAKSPLQRTTLGRKSVP